MQRNALLFWFGLLYFLGGMISTILINYSSTQVNNINAWIKPMKFFFSAAIFSFTMAWLLYELPSMNYNNYSIMVVVVLTFELLVITWQAANGRLSHFNTSKPLYAHLFTLMGVAIVVLTIWTLLVGIHFFTKDTNHIQKGYLWGIRLGIIIFVIAAFEGGLMGARLSHTVGGTDASEGLPILNWSKHYGDLRIAHFFGMHALQILPIAGYYLFKQTQSIIVFSIVYALIVCFFFIQALKGISILKTTSLS